MVEPGTPVRLRPLDRVEFLVLSVDLARVVRVAGRGAARSAARCSPIPSSSDVRRIAH